MTIQFWTSLGGWYAAAVATYIAGVLLFSKPNHTAHDSEQRQQMGKLVILFGWIPIGIVVILGGRLWNYAIGP